MGIVKDLHVRLHISLLTKVRSLRDRQYLHNTANPQVMGITNGLQVLLQSCLLLNPQTIAGLNFIQKFVLIVNELLGTIETSAQTATND